MLGNHSPQKEIFDLVDLLLAHFLTFLDRWNKGVGIGPQSSLPGHVILNHDFSRELHSWQSPAKAYMVEESPDKSDQIAANSGHFYAVVTERREKASMVWSKTSPEGLL